MAQAKTSWEKLRDVLDDAKRNDEVSTILRTASPSEVRDLLLKKYDLSADEVTDLITEFERIADRNSVGFWSPIG
ncbi:MAG: hypothetical protein BMS9Abin28_0447 [Anaerolineae bacterium]|nr:MAG: hypothetical protein BMS9Abin28_0447 [Anaerolineae bacterium]